MRASSTDAVLIAAAAFGLGEMKDADPVQMYLNDVFTVTVNLAGLPGIAVLFSVRAHRRPLRQAARQCCRQMRLMQSRRALCALS